MKKLELVALTYEFQGKPIKKVALVLGDSRAPGKVRLSVWSQSGRSWAAPRAYPRDVVAGPVPESWPQGRAARRAFESGNRPRGQS